jgi:hypothetical protein
MPFDTSSRLEVVVGYNDAAVRSGAARTSQSFNQLEASARRAMATSGGYQVVDELRQMQAASAQAAQSIATLAASQQQAANTANALTTGASGAKQSLAGLTQAAFFAKEALSTIQQAGSQVFQFLNEGARSLELKEAFATQTAQAGQSMDQFLGKLKQASGGTISDMNLITSASKAMSLGVTTDANQMADLLEAARIKARKFGIDTSQAFNDIVTGIGRMSPLILDNLGIVTGGEATFIAYAESIGKTSAELTDAEKKQALLNKVIAEGQAEIAAAGGLYDTAADRLRRFNAEAENGKAAWAEYFAVIATAPIEGLGTSLSGALGASAEAAKQLGTIQAGIDSVSSAIGNQLGTVEQARFEWAVWSGDMETANAIMVQVPEAVNVFNYAIESNAVAFGLATDAAIVNAGANEGVAISADIAGTSLQLMAQAEAQVGADAFGSIGGLVAMMNAINATGREADIARVKIANMIRQRAVAAATYPQYFGKGQQLDPALRGYQSGAQVSSQSVSVAQAKTLNAAQAVRNATLGQEAAQRRVNQQLDLAEASYRKQQYGIQQVNSQAGELARRTGASTKQAQDLLAKQYGVSLQYQRAAESEATKGAARTGAAHTAAARKAETAHTAAAKKAQRAQESAAKASARKWEQEQKRAANEAQRAHEQAARKAQSLWSSAVGKMKSAVEGVLDMSISVSENDMILEKAGMRPQAINEAGRRLQDIVNQGSASPWVNFFPELMGLDEATLKASALKLQQDIEDFIRPDFINKERVFARAKRAIEGQRNKENLVNEVTKWLISEGYAAEEVQRALADELGTSLATGMELMVKGGKFDLVAQMIAVSQGQLEASSAQIQKLGMQFSDEFYGGIARGADKYNIVKIITKQVLDLLNQAAKA